MLYPLRSKHRITHTVEDGQWVEDLLVVHLPGHTPGQIGLLHRRDRTLMCGDALMNRNSRISLPFAGATPDLKTAFVSVMKLQKLEFDHLLPSHGELILDHAHSEVAKFIQNRISNDVDWAS
jgi:glyoxylase-like metal-dependent hydrolase (beta-lactamase superfamily II)